MPGGRTEQVNTGERRLLPAGSAPALHLSYTFGFCLYQYWATGGDGLAQTDGVDETASQLYKAVGGSQYLEFGIAGSETVAQAADGVRARATSLADSVVGALTRAEDDYRRVAWPADHKVLHAALCQAADLLAAHKDALLLLQGERLGLRHEESQYDVFLVSRMQEPTGAYSHPTVINVRKFDGLPLIETIVHEITHVLAFSNRGNAHSVFTQLEKIGAERGIAEQTVRQIAHLLMFYASGSLVNEVVSSSYVSYADANGIYQRVAARGGPAIRDRLAEVWNSVRAGECDAVASASELITAVREGH